MNYHVFIVDKNTFKYHLEYMFAGTGAKDKTVPFLADFNTQIHSITERNLVELIADISRIRIGDKIIFYLQSTEGKPGMFYGVFKAASTAYFDENDDNNYLKDELFKSLTFRIKIEPDCVYPKGVSEHDYLDSLQNINFPFQMCWSLIYRKLKGNRGCTMITDYEFETLVSKLNSVNNNTHLAPNITSATFNTRSFTIEAKNTINVYSGRTDSIDIAERMLYKANKRNAFEVHLQAYIMQNFDKDSLRNLLLPYPDSHCWIGNEVSCGVGMQRIDVMIVQTNDNDVYIKIVELKCIKPYTDILEKQLSWYIRWVTDYVTPNYTATGKTVHIIPCIIAKNTTDTDSFDSCRNYRYTQHHTINNVTVEPAEYISFNVSNNEITFQKTI